LSEVVARYSGELRAYAEVARLEAAVARVKAVNSPTETLNYLWLRVAEHWDGLAERTERLPLKA
jgi:hypothetical protein